MASRIRVLELRSVRGTGGGPEKTILLGAARADHDRFEIVVCYIRDRRDEVFRIGDRAAPLGLDYTEIWERHSFDPGIWPALRALVRDRQIDIVHSHEYKTDAIALCLGRWAGVTPIATVHGWTGQSARERWLYYPVDKRFLARFPRLVAVSTDIKSDLVRHGARPERVAVLLNAVDAAAFRRTPERRGVMRQELGLLPHQVCIGSVGRLEKQKRMDVFLEAVAPLARTHPHLRLTIVGDGSLRPELVSLSTRLGLGDRCRFLGHRLDVAELHQALDLFVQSSEYEGTPNAVLEAMAMETPVIATDVGGTRELAEPGVHATIVRPNDIVALREAVQTFLTSPSEARDRATAARRRVELELSFEMRTRRLEAIYEDLLRERDEIRSMQRIPRHA